ncbi:hypothetical protein [Nocardioides jishulii]|uniref:Uncharacterized protein n=1 Tax=Nocardioides jishulii TaxID=2575440 RepID=A0A4U2YS84_9ACTN|nr:hypothetical protein [Nocardioides jishulii]QCX28738.1 hypothetical protein FCL41_15290 [Nocardioides jishulii]TKI64366.1 hypothetical protein FC770_04280 [Nocardioides jishulii]
MDTLLTDSRATHQLLEKQLARARGAHPSGDPDRPRDQYPPVDTFLATASRHLGATAAVLVPAANKRLPDGSTRTKAYLAQTRQLAMAMAQVKAKLYGSAYAVNSSWKAIWDAVEAELDALEPLEDDLAHELDEHHREGESDLLVELHRAELHSPTRPHPYIPQQGVPGKVARSVARRVDAFWDTAEGRMIPEPIHHHDRRGQGLLVQYLLADPHLESWPVAPEDLAAMDVDDLERTVQDMHRQLSADPDRRSEAHVSGEPAPEDGEDPSR